MKRLNLKIASHSSIDSYFLVDGKRVKSKKDNFGKKCSIIETENDEVEIKIFDFDEMQGKLWFVSSLVFFIISIFGILDIKYKKNCRSIDCKLKVKLKDENNELKISYNKFEDNGLAVNYDSDCEVEVESNRYYINQVSKKRFKIMKWVKITTVVLAVIGVILFFVNM